MIYFKKFSIFYGKKLTLEELGDPILKEDNRGFLRIHGMEVAFEYGELSKRPSAKKFRPTYTAVSKGESTEIYVTCPQSSCRKIFSLDECIVYPIYKRIWTTSPCVWCECGAHVFPYMIDLDKHVPKELDLLG